MKGLCRTSVFIAKMIKRKVQSDRFVDHEKISIGKGRYACLTAITKTMYLPFAQGNQESFLAHR